MSNSVQLEASPDMFSLLSVPMQRTILCDEIKIAHWTLVQQGAAERGAAMSASLIGRLEKRTCRHSLTSTPTAGTAIFHQGGQRGSSSAVLIEISRREPSF